MILLEDYQMFCFQKAYPLESHLPMRPEVLEAVLDAEYALEETGGVIPFIRDQLKSFERASAAGVIFW